MKKIVSLLIVLTLAVSLLAGCASKEPAAEESVKTGIYISTSIEDSKDAGDEDGKGSAASTIVAVTVDANGVIDKCVIDGIQSTVKFSTAGAVTSDTTAEVLSKNELGENYGMKKASSIGKEWNEQMAAFAAYCEGKTVDEVMNISFDENGKVVDLASSVTLTVNYYTYLIKAAVDNAVDAGAHKGDSLRVSAVGSTSGSKDAADGKDGLAQGYYYFGAFTLCEDGTISSSIIDAVQANVNFDATGKITTDLTVAPSTKIELGDAYGMESQSSIGKEWNEQAAAFASYIKGKTAQEVAGIAVDETGKATDADLLASCTIHIGDFLKLVALAAK